MTPDPTRLTTLANLLRDAATDLRSAEPPPHLPPRRVAAACARVSLPAPREAPPAAAGAQAGASGAVARRGPRPAWSAAAGARWLLPAGLLFAVALIVGNGRPGAGGQPAAAPSGDAGTAFVPVRGAEDWPRPVAGGPGVGWLVRTDLPRERLALLGLPFDPARAGERVPADLLLNPEGEVIAIRLVR